MGLFRLVEPVCRQCAQKISQSWWMKRLYYYDGGKIENIIIYLNYIVHIRNFFLNGGGGGT